MRECSRFASNRLRLRSKVGFGRMFEKHKTILCTSGHENVSGMSEKRASVSFKTNPVAPTVPQKNVIEKVIETDPLHSLSYPKDQWNNSLKDHRSHC